MHKQVRLSGLECARILRSSISDVDHGVPENAQNA